MPQSTVSSENTGYQNTILRSEQINPSLHSFFCLLGAEKDTMTSPVLSLNTQNRMRLSLISCFILCTSEGMQSLFKCITLKMIVVWFFSFHIVILLLSFKISLLAKSPHLNPFYCLPTQTLMESKVSSDMRLIFSVVPNNGVRGIIAK